MSNKGRVVLGDESRSSASAVQLSNRVNALRNGTQADSTCDTCGVEYVNNDKLCVYEIALYNYQ